MHVIRGAIIAVNTEHPVLMEVYLYVSPDVQIGEELSVYESVLRGKKDTRVKTAAVSYFGKGVSAQPTVSISVYSSRDRMDRFGHHS